MTRRCATNDCRRACEPNWNVCRQCVARLLTGAFGPTEERIEPVRRLAQELGLVTKGRAA